MIFSKETCSPWEGKRFRNSKYFESFEKTTWKGCGLACNQHPDSKCVAWSYSFTNSICYLYNGIKYPDEPEEITITEFYTEYYHDPTGLGFNARWSETCREYQ